MHKELYFLRSSEQYLAKDLLRYVVRLDEIEDNLDKYPSLEQYERNFGSFSGDVGVYMIVDNKVAGGAWVRLLADGFGHIDHDTPELVVAVKPEFRNQGIGTSIMEQLFVEVSKVFSQISLSISEDNPALSMFEKLGFEKVDGSSYENESGTRSLKMLKRVQEVHQQKEKKHLEEECFRKSFRPTH